MGSTKVKEILGKQLELLASSLSVFKVSPPIWLANLILARDSGWRNGWNGAAGRFKEALTRIISVQSQDTKSEG